MSIIERLVAEHPIRKSAEQKERFRAWFCKTAQDMGYPVKTENKDGHDNLIVGDPEKAQVIFTAHYDTPARFFLPNLMTPRNRVVFFLYQMLIVGVMLGISFGVAIPLGRLIGGEDTTFIIWYIIYMGLLLMMLLGPANKHNVNDNTSGVAAILETMARVPAEERSRFAAILFDNEEKGCRGSKAFAKANPTLKTDAFLINLDCVGDGEHILFMAKKKARGMPQYEKLCAAMEAAQGRTLHMFPMEGGVFNSDQKNFDTAVAVCACHQRKVVGFYTDKIHTGRDTVCEQENLDFLAEGLSAFIRSL